MTRRFGWFLDLAFVVLWTCFVVTLVSQGATGWIRAAAVVPFVTLFPGYTLLATLFPSGGTHRTYPFDRNESGLENPMPTKSGVDGAERFAFSVLLSIVVVAMVALLANFTPWGVTVVPILYGVAGWTLLWTLGALLRRVRIDAEERYVPRPLGLVSALRFSRGPSASWGNESRSTMFDVALGLSILVFATSLGYAAVNPPQETQAAGFTEFYVETENVSGDVESTYPSQFAPGETRTLPVGIANHEQTSVDYHLVVLEQRVDGAGENASVRSEAELDRRTVSLDHGERTVLPLSVSPTTTGTDLRLLVLLYEDSPPADPSLDSAYRSLRLPIDVTSDADSGGA